MSLRKSAITGLTWTYGQMFGGQIISFVVSLILARLLMPAEFGLIGMVTIFLGIGTALFNSGLTSSLVRSVDIDAEDCNAVFYFNLIGSVVAFLVLYLCAPFVATFYHQPILKSVSRVYSLSFVISAFGAVQNSMLVRDMKFKKIFILTLPALLISNCVAVVMAFKGCGVWSLVASALVSRFCVSIALWVSSEWSPRWKFTRQKINRHFSYGYKMALASILDIIFSNIYQVVIGRSYTATLVGYYTRAETLMMLPVGNISGALKTVIFPIFSRVQDDIPRFRNVYKQVMLMIIFLVTPILMLMAALAEPLIIFLFTEKWLPIVPIFRIICIGGILYPIHSYNLMVLEVIGRSDLFLKIESIKKILNAVTLIVSLCFGFYALLWGHIVFSFLALFINAHYAGKYLRYNVFGQLRDLLPVFIMGVLTLAAAYGVDLLLHGQPLLLRLIVAGLAGAGTYLVSSIVIKFQSLEDIKTILLRK